MGTHIKQTKTPLFDFSLENFRPLSSKQKVFKFIGLVCLFCVIFMVKYFELGNIISSFAVAGVILTFIQKGRLNKVGFLMIYLFFIIAFCYGMLFFLGYIEPDKLAKFVDEFYVAIQRESTLFEDVGYDINNMDIVGILLGTLTAGLLWSTLGFVSVFVSKWQNIIPGMFLIFLFTLPIVCFIGYIICF